MSESPQDRPDEADEETQEKPGEPDTDTMGGFPGGGARLQRRRGAIKAGPVVG